MSDNWEIGPRSMASASDGRDDTIERWGAAFRSQDAAEVERIVQQHRAEQLEHVPSTWLGAP